MGCLLELRVAFSSHPPLPTPCPPSPASVQDVFSLGCVLAELFLDGQPLFDYSRLLAYRLGTGTGETGCS